MHPYRHIRLHYESESTWTHGARGIESCRGFVPDERCELCQNSPGAAGSHSTECLAKSACTIGSYLPLPPTIRLFFTEKTFGTSLARRLARFLSLSLSTTPSRVTFPFFTMMWIEGIA